MTRRTKRRGSGGFTLIEMLVTVTILGVLLAIAAPALQQLILNQGVKTASFDLYSALEYARSEAIKRNGSITLKAGAVTDGAWTTGWRVNDSASNSLRSWSPASGLAITEKVGSATAVTFAKDGHLTTAAPKLQVDPTPSLNGVTSRCVQVDLVGRPKALLGACP
jgi:type IV fimbrial biogenesis protein FimT